MEARKEFLRSMGGYASPVREVREATDQGLCKFLDVVFVGRPLPRFWFLETVRY
ncbi:hypothetical protein T492DRAFT_887161 [Pavlovales sp. CCMP2436]|nr:hypothetical protein T492DRAFT_887161 [Pavlovales sp. CCMP2436]